jgi:hypothetical protein
MVSILLQCDVQSIAIVCLSACKYRQMVISIMWLQCGVQYAASVIFSMQQQGYNGHSIKLQNKATHNALHGIKIYEAEVHFVT